jgi:hypothetical protein
MTFLERNSSPSSTSDGDTTISASKKEMNGKPHSKPVTDYSNQQ